jgi:hypothetical protein
MLEGADLVVDCSDSFETRYEVNAACCAARVPLVEGGVVGLAGLVMAIRPGVSACYRCAFPEPPPAGAAPSCAEAGVLGPAAGVIGSLQALEALRLLGASTARCSTPSSTSTSTTTRSCASPRRRADCPDCATLNRMIGIRTAARVLGELRRDVTAAHERDPAARGVTRSRSSRTGRACTRCSPTASRTR